MHPVRVTREETMSPTSLTSSPVDALADRFWESFLELQPVYATVLGDERFDDRLDDPGPDGRAAERTLLASVLAEAAAIETDALPTEERITLDMLRVVANLNLEGLEHRLWQLTSVDPLAGPQTLPGDLARFQRLDTPERFERLLARLDAYPRYLRLHADNIREGAAARRTAALPVVERAITQTRRAVETPTERSPLMVADPGLTADQRERLAAAHDRLVRPALAGFLAALEAYRPAARAGEGLCWLPDGDALYRFSVLASTTLQEDPQALHDYGLERIDAIDRERAAIARSLGHADVASFRAALDADPSNLATEPADLVRLAEAQVARAAAAAPAWFGRLPRASCEVRAVEPHQEQEAPPAFYFPPATDGSRPGIYFINTFEPGSRPLHRLAAATFHEAIPGHHFQIAIEAELEGLPAFRRLGSRLAGAAYPEGWGLYSERLADEMGLYADARERFGMLDAQAWRAVRLVVDTGIHAFRWDRQRSIDLLRTAAGLSQLEAETETDRYIGWPGQALAYTTGQRAIEGLRAELASRDGSRFDLRAFHDQVLGHGSLPLATLQRELPGWVAAMA
jgi:uncharacterized protein (DUF885 family)